MFDYFLRGGPMMWLLLICSVLAIAIIIDRFLVYHRARVDEQELMAKINEILSRGRSDEALNLLRKTGGPVASILMAGLSEKNKGKAQMEEAFESASLNEIPKLEKYLPILSTIAAVSTLLGFTGTVIGMINAFNSIAVAEASSPAIVATGIGQALITTATGLLIAIPTVVFHQYFTHRVDGFVLEIEKCCKELTKKV